jgi:hypothetical protein
MRKSDHFEEMKNKLPLQSMKDILKVHEDDAKLRQVYVKQCHKKLARLIESLAKPSISPIEILDQIISAAFEAKMHEIVLMELSGKVRYWDALIHYCEAHK